MQADARLHWSDDALLRRALGTTRAEVNEQAERHHWDSALTEATLRRQTSRTLVSAIEAAVERDPERARSLHTRYEQHIEASDRAALDALLAEAQTREHARQASMDILNATPPENEPSVPQWRLRQAEAIADPATRAATIRTLHSAAAADEARARTLAEQVLARVLKDGLTDTSQIPVRDWVKLDADHRQAIETRLGHNARGSEPAPNPALVVELATEMTEAPHIFARRDLVPAVARLPLPQWQRFHDWQAGIRRNDPATEDQLYAIKRGLRIAEKMLPASGADEATNARAELVEEIDTKHRIAGKRPDDADIADTVARHVPTEPRSTQTLEWNRRSTIESTPLSFVPSLPPPGDRPGIHRVQANRATAPSAGTLAELRALTVIAERATIAAQRELAAAMTRAANARAALQAIPSSNAAAMSVAVQALQAANRALEATAREHAELREWEADLRAAMADWGYAFSGQRFPPRIAQKNEIAEAARLGFVPTDAAPIDAQGRQVFVNPSTGEHIVRAIDPRTPGAWELFDANLNWQGFRDRTLEERYPDPPLRQFFPHAVAMTPEEKKWQEKVRARQRDREILRANGVAEDLLPPELPPEDPEEKARKDKEAVARAEAEGLAEEKYSELAKKYDWKAESQRARQAIDNLDMDLEDFISKFKKGSIRAEVDTGLRAKGRSVRHALDHPTEGRRMRKLLMQERFDK
ncbi:MAG: hypothetical protein KF889_28105 [Alphaproteobacteria bacterium]|nr:hypothetical protein [Alphaproteobacteria bacterium]MCW5743819.1 hypothetical protein [Alphaproteobacteria bacterium]